MTEVERALAALVAGDPVAARSALSDAPADSALARGLADFLGAQRAPGVYDEPTAFEAFIDHGANPELYRRTIEVLAAVHADVRPDAVADIGCGDGRVTAAVLDRATTRVDLVEPSIALLRHAVDAVARPGAEVVAHPIGASDLAAEVDADQRWDVVQSTYAMHTIPPADRPALFEWLAGRCDRLLIVEFDVPALDDRSPAHIAYLAERYEAGVREYLDHPEAIDGFLMPVLVGQLQPAAARHTFEQPIAEWEARLRDAGFRTTTRPVFDYWWAPAVLIDARPS